MKKVFKNFTKEWYELIEYLFIFIGITILLTILMTIVASIPTEKVEKNLKRATLFFQNHISEITTTKKNNEYSYLHPYADEIILNIIKCLDTEKPLKSILEAKYYTDHVNDMSNNKYIILMANDVEGNTEYIRYWHGSILFVKPLLMFLKLEHIYILNAIILGILLMTLLFILLKKKYFAIAIALVIGLICGAVWYVPFCIEYVSTFYIMFLVSIISTIIETKSEENKRNKKLYKLFFISGILTCFFDFLTTEIITILIPLAIILSIRMREKNFKSFKKEMLFLITSLSIWMIGYTAMWIAKWTLASIVLHINAMDYVKEKAIYRINGEKYFPTMSELVYNTMKRNITTIYPLNFIKSKFNEILRGIGIALLVILILIKWKDKKRVKYAICMGLVAIIPYIRYVVLLQHSYMHAFFTFRSQIPTIMCILLILINCTRIRREKIEESDVKRLVEGIYKKEKGNKMKELTILMPCLNEEKTLRTCINKAKQFIKENEIDGEILIADNGSTDNSIEIAKEEEVRIVEIKEKGYGNVLINGSKHSEGKYTIMGDSDDSYNFLEIMPILEKLRNGADLVMGNRYTGKMEKGAMKWSHKYIGTPIISFIGRKKYKLKIGDFNCGLRGYVTEKINNLECKSTGMEYATEMLIKAKKEGLIIEEVSINFYKDGRNSKSHLNTISDGIRHFKIIKDL